MVPKQILRTISRGLVALICVGLVDQAGANSEDGSERTLIIDLADGSDHRATFDALVAALDLDKRIAVVKPPRASSETVTDDDGREELRLLASASEAFHGQDCALAAKLSEQAIELLAAQQARGKDVKGDLTQAYTYKFHCAEKRMAGNEAAISIERLRSLGHDTAPLGLSADAWARYPAVDASGNRYLGEVVITSTPPGGRVWVDHVEVGTSPMKLSLAHGDHWIAIGKDGAAAVEHFSHERWTTPVDLAIPVRSQAEQEAHRLSALFIRWKRTVAPIAASEVGDVLRAYDCRVLVMVKASGQAEIWIRPHGSRLGKRSAAAPANDPAYVARLIVEYAQGGTVDTVPALVREDPSKKPTQKDGVRSKKWWLYVAIGAAVTIAGAVVVADELADDRQRIELVLP